MSQRSKGESILIALEGDVESPNILTKLLNMRIIKSWYSLREGTSFLLILFHYSMFFSADSTVCFINIAIVTGPTPPGTGVIALATS